MSSPSPSTAPRDPLANKGQLGKMWWSARNPPAQVTTSFEGRTVLVTGANTGLGFQAAVKYATLGASCLILTVRSAVKAEETKARVLKESGRVDGDFIIALPVDLSTLVSVRDFVAVLSARVPHIDVALLNAGIAPPSFTRSPDGHEMGVQVNVLSTALMAILLLPKLRASAAAGRGPVNLCFVNSHAHTEVKREWLRNRTLYVATTDEASWEMQRNYYMVKLLAIPAILRIIAAVKGQNIVVNMSCPFLCRTDLGRDFGLGAQIFNGGFQTVFARSAEEGSRTLVSATALGPESTGKLWMHDILYPLGPLVDDAQLMDEAWEDILNILEPAAPSIRQIITRQ
ncbi:hypothetical protein ACHAQA_002294 [Verticillium albo-atrum]